MAWGEFQSAESIWRGVGQLPGMHGINLTRAEANIIILKFYKNMLCTTRNSCISGSSTIREHN